MYTVNLKQNLFNGLAVILENMAPSKVPTLKHMKWAQKSADKFLKASESFNALQKEIMDKTAELNKKMKAAKTDEEKKVVEDEANETILPLIKKRDEIGAEIASVDLSDEEIEFLRANYKKLLADSFKTIKVALEIADALDVKDVEVKEDEKK